MVNDTYPARHDYAEVKTSDPMNVELYEQCFVLESPHQVIKPEPKAIFAKVIRQIETMDLPLRTDTPREAVIPRGYVFAIHEVDSNFVTIGHGGRVALASTLRTLQLGNPRQLEIIAVLQRASYDDARALCGLITSGMTMYKTRGRTWYTMEDCCRKVVAMFARVDRIDGSELLSPPVLRR